MLKLKLAGVLFLLGFSGVAVAGPVVPKPVSLVLDGGTFKVQGWAAPSVEPPQGWASVFLVYAGTGDVPPLLGKYAVESGTLVFHPIYPSAPGVHYRVVFRPPGGALVEKRIDGPARDTIPVAHVEHVYPSSDVLPSNELRIYFYFSAAMSRGQAFNRIHILDENGKVLPDVFLPGEELWDPSFKRLTLTFDPGRIKRGLVSNERAGPPIAEGKRYTLVVDREWPDARGVPMTESFRKRFRGGPAVRTAPDPEKWKVAAPKAGTSGAVVVDFPEPMNYPLLTRMLQVSGEDGKVAGAVSIGRNETEWRFTPAQPWNAGKYQLVVDTGIEDLAGNHVGQLFEIDVFKKVSEHIDTKTVSRGFEVR